MPFSHSIDTRSGSPFAVGVLETLSVKWFLCSVPPTNESLQDYNEFLPNITNNGYLTGR